jgi:hypothetical protein
MITLTTIGQVSDYTLVSSDEVFAIKLSRSDYSVDITIMLTHAQQFELVSIERSPVENANFTQCKYIGLHEVV